MAPAADTLPPIDPTVAHDNGVQAAAKEKKNEKRSGNAAAAAAPPAFRGPSSLLPPAASSSSSFARSFIKLRSAAGAAYLDPRSLKVVRALGEGGFAKVDLCEILPGAPGSTPPPRPLDAAAAAGNLAPAASAASSSSEHNTNNNGPADNARRLVAVKRLHPHLFSTPKELDAFTGEIRLLKQLSHPNVVAFVGAGALEDAKSAFIAQEFVGGGTLGQLIAKQCMQGGGGEQVGAAADADGDPTGASFRRRSSGVFASLFSTQAVYQAGDAVDIMLQVARALAYLHARSPMVLHRDVKPDNVLLAAPHPSAAAAARRRRRMAQLAQLAGGGGVGGVGGGSGSGHLSAEAAAAAAAAAAGTGPCAVTPSGPSSTVAAGSEPAAAPAPALGPGVANGAGAPRARSVPGRRPSFGSLSAETGPIEPEREWVAKLTDFGLSTAVGARRQKEQIQRVASAALARSGRSSAVVGGGAASGSAGPASSAGGSGASAFSAAGLASLRAEAASSGGVRASIAEEEEQAQGGAWRGGGPAAAVSALATASSGELELDWNLRIQSRAMVAPSFRAAAGHHANGGGNGGALAPVGEKSGGGGGDSGGLPAAAAADPRAASDAAADAAFAGGYELTRNTGSLMYMAPEVFKGERYDDKADVFSFGVLLRETLAAYLTSFAMGSVAEIEMYASRVSNGFRPPLDSRWPEPLRSLIADCWHQDPRRRPAMAEAVARLERAVCELPLLPRVGREPAAVVAVAGGAAEAGGGAEAGVKQAPAMCGACVVQ